MIYFIQLAKGGPIKIGTTGRLTIRLGEHYATYRRPACVLGVMAGDRDAEQIIHHRLRDDRIEKPPKEWFMPSVEVLTFIENMTDAWDGTDDRPARLDARISVLNVAGTREEKDFLDRIVRQSGVPASTIVRRGIAMWARENFGVEPPAAWLPE